MTIMSAPFMNALCIWFSFSVISFLFFYYSLKMMMWAILLAKEREIAITAENLNDVVDKAKAELKEGERIVSIRIKR